MERIEQKEFFTQLLGLNVNEHTEQKGNLTYLSWAWAWVEFKKICPDATYEIKRFTNAITGETLPYLVDNNTGYMCFTSVTANGLTYDMWLPVMDNKNRALKVGEATMFDVNKTIMRCLVKNLAMFGLGTYIYAGEDLPEIVEEKATAEQVERMRELKVLEQNVCKKFGVSKLEYLTQSQAKFVIESKENALKGENK